MSHIAGLSLYAQQAILTAIKAGAAFTCSTLYLGLDTTEADANDLNGVEVSTTGTAYARQAISFAAPSTDSMSSNADITFPTATASYGTVVAFRIWDNATVGLGNCIARGVCTSKAIEVSDRYQILSGNLTISLARTIT